nr:MAG TPA: hypothetical protein [Caudoviricetes sp.]
MAKLNHRRNILSIRFNNSLPNSLSMRSNNSLQFN